MASLKGINGANGIGKNNKTHQPDTHGTEFEKIFQKEIKEIGNQIPDKNDPFTSYGTDEKFATDVEEIWGIINPVIEKVTNNGPSPPI